MIKFYLNYGTGGQTMRLIDAEDIKDYWVESEGSKEEFIKENMPDDADYTEYSEFFDKVLQVFKNVVDTSPTINAEPVVRCKDCKYRNNEYCEQFCEVLGKFTNDKFYCSYGAKMDEE